MGVMFLYSLFPHCAPGASGDFGVSMHVQDDIVGAIIK